MPLSTAVTRAKQGKISHSATGCQATTPGAVPAKSSADSNRTIVPLHPAGKIPHEVEIAADRAGGLFFEAAIDGLLLKHVCRAIPLGRLHAMEIDTPQDHAAARELWCS